MLTPNEWLLIGVVFAALVLIVSDRFRVDLVALLVLLALTATGLVTPSEAISGFSSPAVVVLMGLFVITHTLENTGIIQYLARRIESVGGHNEVLVVFIFTMAGATLALFMNNVASGALLLPAAMYVARNTNISPSRLLIPIAFGTLSGGMASYFPTANVILNTILVEQGVQALTIVDFFSTGSMIVLPGVAFLVLVGRRMLPERASVSQTVTPQSLSKRMRETYRLDDRLWELRIRPDSRLVNTALSHSHIGSDLGVTVIAIWRGHHAILAPNPIEIINANDYLLVMGREERVRQLADWGVIIGRENGAIAKDHDYSVDLTEMIIPPRSEAIGRNLIDLNFRKKYGLTSVALWREGRSYRTDVGKMRLQVGDALLMVGPRSKIEKLSQERDYMLLQSSHMYQPPSPEKAGWSLGVLALVLLSAIFQLVPLALAVLAGWVVLVLSKTIPMDEAYDSVDWRVIFLVVGMLPVGTAMVSTGLAERIGVTMVSLLYPMGALALIAGLYLVTMLVAQIIGGQVTALVLGPIALTAAAQAGIDPRAMAITVAVGCASCFLTPVAHPVNILMMGPGGYRFSDFTRVGVFMVAITFTMLLVAMHVVWGIG